MTRPAVAFACLVLSVGGVCADEPSPPEGAKAAVDRADEALAAARTLLSEYRITFGDAADAAALRFVEEPVLRWTAPTGGECYGGVFVWTDGDRPAVVASLLKWYAPFTHSGLELHSLTDRPLTARVGGEVLWRTDGPGVTWAALDRAAPPARTEAARLVQMRRLAGTFTGEATNREKGEEELRLMEQPLVRYGGPSGSPADGGLFAFARGTDPEIVLLIEPSGGGWRWAAARLNSIDLRLVREGERAWAAPEISWSAASDPTRPYNYRRIGPLVRR